MRTSLRLPATVPASGPARGVRARTYQRLLACAMQMANGGRLGIVAEVAAAASVSRSNAHDGRARIQELFSDTFPRFKEFEPHMRAALQLALEHWALERAGTLEEPPYRRGHRTKILAHAAAPLKAQLTAAEFARLVRALSLIYGIESYVVLKDIWGATDRQVEAIARWAADAMVVTALAGARARGRANGVHTHRAGGAVRSARRSSAR